MGIIDSRDNYAALTESEPAIVRRARTGSAKAAIRMFCRTCMPGSRADIEACPSKVCPLWPYRFGTGFHDPGLPIPPVDEEKAAKAKRRFGRNT